MLLVVAVRVLEAMFAIGVVGCVFVVALTTLEDVRMLFGRDESEQGLVPQSTPSQSSLPESSPLTKPKYS